MSVDDSVVATVKKTKNAKKEAASPAETTKAQVAKIEAELTKILKDQSNDDMSYAGEFVGVFFLACVGPSAPHRSPS